MKHNTVICKVELGLPNSSTPAIATLLSFKIFMRKSSFSLRLTEKYWLLSNIWNLLKVLLSCTFLIHYSSRSKVPVRLFQKKQWVSEWVNEWIKKYIFIYYYVFMIHLFKTMKKIYLLINSKIYKVYIYIYIYIYISCGSFSCFRGHFRFFQDFVYNLRFKLSSIVVFCRMVHEKKLFGRSSVKYHTFSEGPVWSDLFSLWS